MGKKPQKAGKTPGPKDEEEESSLQAVVLADSFETRFNPFTLERPRCLLPLANTPLIEYTLEFLANAGVEDIFVYCGAHTDQVEEYVKKSKWSLTSSPFSKLHIIKSASHSIGDMMRDLDKRDVIKGDFLIVSGDVVSNFPLEEALAKHRARRSVDKAAIMTMVLREAGTIHRTKAQGASPVFVIDPTKDRCLHYEEMHPGQNGRHISIDQDLLSSHTEIDVRNDLIDCYIDICTPDVLALWTDSFDYESPRKQFLFGVLKDYELNGKTIHTHIVNDHYAARVRNIQSYDAISKDVITRWAYPICPESNLLKGQTFKLSRGNIYQEDGVMLSRSCKIGRRTVIGRGSSIGDGSVISNCVIGRRCQIGRNVRLEGAYVWNDAVIGDGSEVTRSIIASEAVVGKNCKIRAGALLSFGVQVAEGKEISGTQRITQFKPKKEDPDETSGKESDLNLVGEGGVGYNFIESGSDEEDEFETLSSRLVFKQSDFAISDSSISTLSSDGYDALSDTGRSKADSFASVASDEGIAENRFHQELASSIHDSLQKGDDSTIISLELQGMRLSNDASYHQVRRAIASAFMRRVEQVIEIQKVGDTEAVTQVISPHHELFNKVIFDHDKAEKDDQVDFLLALQRDLSNREKGENILFSVAKKLYEMDVIEEDGFNQWWADPRSIEGSNIERVRAKTLHFIEWLANAEEDSDEDEDSA